MDIGTEEGNESVGACVVILFVIIAGISIISRTIYYIDLFGGIAIIAMGGGLLLICIFSMFSDSSKPTDAPIGTTSCTICPECGKSFTYSYKSKDAFGRVNCIHCRKTFNPMKSSDSVTSIKQQPLELPHGVPHPLVVDCRDSEAAASLANTRISYSVTRKAARDIVASLGLNELEALLQAGADYLNANRIAAALACFYEAELINFDHEKLVELRIRFNRPSQSFNDIAEEYFNET